MGRWEWKNMYLRYFLNICNRRPIKQYPLAISENWDISSNTTKTLYICVSVSVVVVAPPLLCCPITWFVDKAVLELKEIASWVLEISTQPSTWVSALNISFSNQALATVLPSTLLHILLNLNCPGSHYQHCTLPELTDSQEEE